MAGGTDGPPGALPVGVIGLVVGCLIAWRSALHNGVFDDTYWHWAMGIGCSTTTGS